MVIGMGLMMGMAMEVMISNLMGMAMENVMTTGMGIQVCELVEVLEEMILNLSESIFVQKSEKNENISCILLGHITHLLQCF